MMTVRWNVRAGLLRRAIGWVAILLSALVGELGAQEPESTWVPQEKARIGVLLEETCEATLAADVVSVETTRPDLERVFLTITGSALESDG